MDCAREPGGAVAQVDDVTLSLWQARTDRKDMPAAAAIARRLRGKPPGTPVPGNATLAGQLDASSATISRAKHLLASEGIIRKGHDGQYYTT
jgi:hypothetical protein